MLHWLSHLLGLDNASGPLYLWWSGSGPDLLQLIEYMGLAGLWYYHHICHEEDCHRYGRHLDSDGFRRCLRCRRKVVSGMSQGIEEGGVGRR